MPIRRVLLVIFVLAASASVAQAHNTPYSWTVTKARVMLQDSATIGLPSDQKASLNTEIQAWLDQFRRLLLIAQQDPDDWRLAGMYDSYVKRFLSARNTVSSGLSIDSATCVGTGKVFSGKRYKHFRCAATSYVLEIPSIELKPGADQALPEVVEGPRTLIGPLQAAFTVHVTGKARMLAQRS